MAFRNLLSRVQTLVFGADPLRSRRRQPRIACDFQVLCRVGDIDDVEARMLDLGPEGLRLRLPVPIKRRQEIWVSALPGDSADERQRLRCLVAWSRSDESGWEVGLKYADTAENLATAFTQFTFRRLERQGRRVSAGFPVEIHDLKGHLLSHGTVRDLSLGGALILSSEPLPLDETLRLRLTELRGESALYLLARVVSRRGGAHSLQFFPADRTEGARLRRLLASLIASLRKSGSQASDLPASQTSEPVPTAAPALGPAQGPHFVPPVMIPGMLTLRGTLESALASPLPLFEQELEVEPAPARPVPAASDLLLADARRGWLASCPVGDDYTVSEHWDPAWLGASLPGQSSLERVHGFLALLALGGVEALSTLFLTARICRDLSRALGVSDETTLLLVHWAALLADVGELEWLLAGQTQTYRKRVASYLGTLTPPDSTLAEREDLLVPAWLLLRRPELGLGGLRDHPARGASLLRELAGLQRLAPVVRAHHERWDGTGFPDGLAGAQIPLVARCLAVADTYARLLAQGFDEPRARAVVLTGSGSYFDPRVVRAFASLELRGPEP